jgi:hypothetical protein
MMLVRMFDPTITRGGPQILGLPRITKRDSRVHARRRQVTGRAKP